MKIRVLTLKYNEGLQGFSEDAVVNASGGYNILEVREHFFVHGGVPHLTLILSLGESTEKQDRTFRKSDPEKELEDSLKPLFRQLREWRNEKAKQEGIPSYLIFRNSQLADICRKLPKTKAGLKEIEGIGEATVKKYGDDIIKILPEDKLL